MSNNNNNIDLNIQCYKFSQDLITLISNSGLPITVAYLILKDTCQQVEKTKNNYLSILSSESIEKVSVPLSINEEDNQDNKEDLEEKEN